MAVDLEDEGRSAGMLRGIFDQDRDVPQPDAADLDARADIALAELIRWLRRAEDRECARKGRDRWLRAFVDGYAEGRAAAATSGQGADGPLRPSQVLPPRVGYVCLWCRAAVAAEVSGFDLDQEGVTRALGDSAILDHLARALGADIPGHRCEAREGMGTCACGCALWREQPPPERS